MLGTRGQTGRQGKQHRFDSYDRRHEEREVENSDLGLLLVKTTPGGSLGFLLLNAAETYFGFSLMHLTNARTQRTEGLYRVRERRVFIFMY